MLGKCQQTFCFQKFVDITQQCFALLPQVNFTANNLNFHWRWRWWDRIQAIFLNLFYFNILFAFICLFCLCLFAFNTLLSYFTKRWGSTSDFREPSPGPNASPNGQAVHRRLQQTGSMGILRSPYGSQSNLDRSNRHG